MLLTVGNIPLPTNVPGALEAFQAFMKVWAHLMHLPTKQVREAPRELQEEPMGARRGTVNDPPWVTNEYTKCNYVRHVIDSSTKAQGWTPAPNNRGTIDILWSSCLTIFLCSWTALCLNLPPQT
jgi:hypothetical protein